MFALYTLKADTSDSKLLEKLYSDVSRKCRSLEYYLKEFSPSSKHLDTYEAAEKTIVLLVGCVQQQVQCCNRYPKSKFGPIFSNDPELKSAWRDLKSDLESLYKVADRASARNYRRAAIWLKIDPAVASYGPVIYRLGQMIGHI